MQKKKKKKKKKDSSNSTIMNPTYSTLEKILNTISTVSFFLFKNICRYTLFFKINLSKYFIIIILLQILNRQKIY